MTLDKKNNGRKSAKIDEKRMKKHVYPFASFRALQVNYDLIEKYKKALIEKGAKKTTIKHNWRSYGERSGWECFPE